MDVFADYAIIHEMLSCGDESNLLDRLLSDKDKGTWLQVAVRSLRCV